MIFTIALKISSWNFFFSLFLYSADSSLPLSLPDLMHDTVDTSSGKKPRRNRTTFTSLQLTALEKIFERTHYPGMVIYTDLLPKY